MDVPAALTNLIDGTVIADQVRGEIRERVAAWVEAGGRRPGLAMIVVGDDPGSTAYVASKEKACEEVGIAGFKDALPAETSQEELEALVEELNEDPRVSGILVQLPLPAHIDAQAVMERIGPLKDVDGLTVASTGLLAKGRPSLLPCTPAGCMELLRRHKVPVDGAEAVVLGRSNLVGKPIAQLLLEANASVTICHSRTRDLASECRRADILVAAVGQPRMVQGDWIKEGATVIDVGINRLDEGLVGDVDFEAAAPHAGLITPVPGGVGPMTIAMLLRNTFDAARAQTTATSGDVTAPIP